MFYRFVDNRFFPGCIDAFLVLSTRNDPGEGGTEKNDIKYDGVCMWNLSLFHNPFSSSSSVNEPISGRIARASLSLDSECTESHLQAVQDGGKCCRAGDDHLIVAL